MTRKEPHAHRIVFSETDAAGIAHFTRLLAHVEDAVHAHLERRGIPVFEPGRRGWPVVGLNVEFLSPARFGETTKTLIRLQRAGNSSLALAFEMRGARRVVVCKGEITLCLVDARIGRPMPIPPGWKSKLAGPAPKKLTKSREDGA